MRNKMPYSITKVKGRNCYQVKNKSTGRVYSKCSPLSKAKAQLRLLHGVESGWHPTGKSYSRKRKGRRSKKSRR